MKKALYLTAAALALTGCGSETSYQMNATRENQSPIQKEMQPGDYTLSLEQYTVNKDATVDTEELGTLINSTKGQFDLKTGGQESGTLEMYDFSGNKFPDAVLIRRNNNEIVSIGLDVKSDSYEALRKKLEERVTIFHP